mmetsp:Transcript_10943/g.22022  ORF Transcript_10943/g.22022 Transcript_10943/m.22022 type:complete len:221 (+) Transcript_10943:517-1179(+)
MDASVHAPPRPRLPLDCPLRRRLCSVEHLQQVVDALAHAHVHECLAAFDVVVEVVAELAERGHARVCFVLVPMPLEQRKRDEHNAFSFVDRQPFQLSRCCSREGDRRRGGQCWLAPRVRKLAQEHLRNDPVVLVCEGDSEHNDHRVLLALLEVDGFIFPVWDLDGEVRRRPIPDCVEIPEERRSEHVALNHGHVINECFGANRWNSGQVERHAEVEDLAI